MDETLIYLLVLLGILLVPLISILLNYYFERKKLAAETEKIQLQNKITKEITYDQLKKESKQKDIKSKLEIFQRLVKLEEEIKSKENKTANDQKKLESLEMIKKEFKETFAEESEEKKQLEDKVKNLETKKSTESAKNSSNRRKNNDIK